MQKSNQPLVAIALPVYNGEKFVRECLEHICAQTYQNWICYVTDNASTDRTNSIVSEFASKDNRITVFRNDKTVSGPQNWNISLGRFANVEGIKYIKYECADDWMFPNCLEEMVALHESCDELGVVYGYRLEDRYVDCDGLDIYGGNIIDGKEMLRRSMRLNIIGGLGQGLYRYSVMKQIDSNLHVINEKSIHCDVEMNDNVMLRSKVGFVFKVLTYYRRHDGQILSFAVRGNTVLSDNERRLYMFRDMFPEAEQIYQNHRMDYALFLWKCRCNHQQDVIDWHNQHNPRPITQKEYQNAKRIYRQDAYKMFRMSIAHIFTSIFKQ